MRIILLVEESKSTQPHPLNPREVVAIVTQHIGFAKATKYLNTFFCPEHKDSFLNFPSGAEIHKILSKGEFFRRFLLLCLRLIFDSKEARIDEFSRIPLFNTNKLVKFHAFFFQIGIDCSFPDIEDPPF